MAGNTYATAEVRSALAPPRVEHVLRLPGPCGSLVEVRKTPRYESEDLDAEEEWNFLTLAQGRILSQGFPPHVPEDEGLPAIVLTDVDGLPGFLAETADASPHTALVNRRARESAYAYGGFLRRGRGESVWIWEDCEWQIMIPDVGVPSETLALSFGREHPDHVFLSDPAFGAVGTQFESPVAQLLSRHRNNHLLAPPAMPEVEVHVNGNPLQLVRPRHRVFSEEAERAWMVLTQNYSFQPTPGLDLRSHPAPPPAGEMPAITATDVDGTPAQIPVRFGEISQERRALYYRHFDTVRRYIGESMFFWNVNTRAWECLIDELGFPPQGTSDTLSDISMEDTDREYLSDAEAEDHPDASSDVDMEDGPESSSDADMEDADWESESDVEMVAANPEPPSGISMEYFIDASRFPLSLSSEDPLDSAIAALPQTRVDADIIARGTGNGPAYSEMCTICRELYCVGDCITTLPCSHFFHSSCIEEWLPMSAGQGQCPYCRAALIPSVDTSVDDASVYSEQAGSNYAEADDFLARLRRELYGGRTNSVEEFAVGFDRVGAEYLRYLPGLFVRPMLLRVRLHWSRRGGHIYYHGLEQAGDEDHRVFDPIFEADEDSMD